MDTWNDVELLEDTYSLDSRSAGKIYTANEDKSCAMGVTIKCDLREEKPAGCRLNVRMNAAFVLAAALIIKAVYMLAVNIVARGHIKQHLLTFGDVIVASASNKELRVHGYV